MDFNNFDRETHEINNEKRNNLFEMQNYIISLSSLDDTNIIREELKKLFSFPLENEEILSSYHFTLLELIKKLSRLTKIDITFTEDILDLCDRDIEILNKIGSEISGYTVPSLSKKAIILERKGEYQKAIEICDYAINNNFLDEKKSFDIRKQRLLAAMDKTQNQPENKILRKSSGQTSSKTINDTNKKEWQYFENQELMYKSYEEYIDEELEERYDERAEQYELKSIDFASSTRVTRIYFKKIFYYRTIERYIQRDYVRTPIYSDWKTKSSEIKKTIKLTNQELENLCYNSDSLIRIFSRKIIFKLNDVSLFPSWIKEETINNYCKYLVQNEEFKIERANDDFMLLENNLNTYIENIKKEIVILNIKLNKLQKRGNKLTKAYARKKSIIKSIFTIGFYAILTSENKKAKIEDKININTKNFQELNEQIQDKESFIEKTQYQIIQEREKRDLKIEKIKKVMEQIIAQSKIALSKVEKLPTYIDNPDDFIPLKTIAGLKNEQITGCYIIRNNENDKYYVGQSKDVFKRLKQHFNGTTPKNIIFAEDYYNSQFKNKEDLFSVKILKLITKDQLDSTEKQLIADYDSFNNGYNGTGGNT